MIASVAAYLADWRRRHPDATCCDRVALILAALEAEFAPVRRGAA